jgi:hypothetical protein
VYTVDNHQMMVRVRISWCRINLHPPTSRHSGVGKRVHSKILYFSGSLISYASHFGSTGHPHAPHAGMPFTFRDSRVLRGDGPTQPRKHGIDDDALIVTS